MARKRFKTNPRKDKKKFSATAERTNSKNIPKLTRRGGIRL